MIDLKLNYSNLKTKIKLNLGGAAHPGPPSDPPLHGWELGRLRSGSEYRAPGRTSVEDLPADHVVFSTCPRRQLIPCMHAPSQTPVNPLSPSLPRFYKLLPMYLY